jgi:ABC-type cobalamin/Fe3+-siderophores transport system ATPase subunit
VECIEGLRNPDRGTVSVLGLNPHQERAELTQRLGVQLQDSQLGAAVPALTVAAEGSMPTALQLGTLAAWAVAFGLAAAKFFRWE